MALPLQRQADIDHGQAGADQQHRPARIQALHRGRLPGIGEIARQIRLRRRKVAERQDQGVQAVGHAARRGQDDLVALAAGAGRLVHQQMQIAAAAQPGDRIQQQMLDIGAIDLAAHEPSGGAVDPGSRPVGLRQAAEPAREMVRLVAERAHVLDPDIEQVVGILGAVGKAGAEPLRALDQIDPVVRPAAPQQMQGHQHAAGASTDHPDPPAALAVVRLRRQVMRRCQRMGERDHPKAHVPSNAGSGRARELAGRNADKDDLRYRHNANWPA